MLSQIAKVWQMVSFECGRQVDYVNEIRPPSTSDLIPPPFGRTVGPEIDDGQADAG
jgi:hypothetical protein